jgi:hypothetical protein
MKFSMYTRRIALGAVLATMLAIAGCKVGVGVSTSIPAPWGSVNVGTSTHFPSYGW